MVSASRPPFPAVCSQSATGLSAVASHNLTNNALKPDCVLTQFSGGRFIARMAADAEHQIVHVESRSAYFKIGFRPEVRHSRNISPARSLAHIRVRPQIHVHPRTFHPKAGRYPDFSRDVR